MTQIASSPAPLAKSKLPTMEESTQRSEDLNRQNAAFQVDMQAQNNLLAQQGARAKYAENVADMAKTLAKSAGDTAKGTV